MPLLSALRRAVLGDPGAMAIAWGRAHPGLTGIEAIGLDEVQWQRGLYLTSVYQIDTARERLLWIGQDRHALHIFDRFHIATHMSQAIAEIWRPEAQDPRRPGCQPRLTKVRWLFLKRHDHRATVEWTRLADLVRQNLKAVHSALLRGAFDPLWSYVDDWARAFLDEWCDQAMRSPIAQMKTVARMLRRHRSLSLNWFSARGQISATSVEGLTRKACGFPSYHSLAITLCHTLGHFYRSRRLPTDSAEDPTILTR